MTRTYCRAVLFLTACLSSFSWLIPHPGVAAPSAPPPRPRLVIALVVDQFRADYLTRFRSRFGAGGFRYLMEQGAYYPAAQYNLLQNMTGPGHATILSGSYPYQAGVPVNKWLDGASGKEVYCVSDESARIVGAPAGAKLPGMSPRNFIGTTIGDELKNAGHASRVISVSLKDRAAILMGGRRADLAVWFEPSTFRWVSSDYYLGKGNLPDWVEHENSAIAARKGETYRWEPRGKLTGLTLGTDAGVHHSAPIGSKESIAMPYGLEITARLAKGAFDSLHLGRGTSPDLLAISFSSHDYMGHMYGANTAEMEEMTVAGDRVIADLLAHVRDRLPGGLRDVALVLTGDHGVSPSHSWLSTVKVDAGKLSAEELSARIETRLKSKFGEPAGGKWVKGQSDLNFYLDLPQASARGLDEAQFQSEARRAIEDAPGVAHVFTRADYDAHRLPPGQFERQILNSYFRGRSGDLIVIPRPFYVLDDEYPIEHMTGYSYDRLVPLIIAGPGIRRGTYATAAEVTDIAPTLAYLLGTLPPALSEGRVLSEALLPVRTPPMAPPMLRGRVTGKNPAKGSQAAGRAAG